MKQNFISFAIAAITLFLSVSGCMKPTPDNDNGFHGDPPMGSLSLVIANQGQFNNGDASLTLYDPASETVENNIFFKANNAKLGDIAQSLNYHNGKLWIVVNNSHIIFATDPFTFKEKGRITGLTSPRNIHFISEEKAYVTQMYSSRIAIINPKTYEITGYIETSVKDGTEQLVQIGKYIYTNCWTNQKKVLKIDSETDKIVGHAETGIQPACIVSDKDGKLWVLTDGGHQWCTIGEEEPALSIVNPETLQVERKMKFSKGNFVSSLCTNRDKDTIYYLNNGVYKMSIGDNTLPEKAFIPNDGGNLYALSVNPKPGFNMIAVSDAIDYKQNGKVLIYDFEGKKTDEFSVGICPGAFCWY